MSAAAPAQLLDFSFDNGLFFQLDSSPTDVNVGADPPQFGTSTASGEYYGFFDPATFPNGQGGGYDFNDYQDANGLYSGAKLFSGTEANPTFLVGDYDLIKRSSGASVRLSISPSAPGAPGPELGGGLLSAAVAALMLLATRRRRGEPVLRVA